MKRSKKSEANTEKSTKTTDSKAEDKDETTEDRENRIETVEGNDEKQMLGYYLSQKKTSDGQVNLIQ